MAPFDALSGQRCRTPLNWSEAGERTLFDKREFEDGTDEAKELPRQGNRTSTL
jgi:hypothetical protein